MYALLDNGFRSPRCRRGACPPRVWSKGLFYLLIILREGYLRSVSLAHTAHHSEGLRPHARVRPCQKRTSPPRRLSESLRPQRLCVRFSFSRYSLSTGDCQLSASSFPLTPAFPPFAPTTLNSHICNIVPTIGGRVPLVRPIGQTTMQASLPSPFSPYVNLESDPLPHGSRVTGHWSPCPSHCALARKVPKSPHCWSQKHSAARRCLIPRADKGWGRW